MKTENKTFWENENIIATQDVAKHVSDFELFLFQKAKERSLNQGTVKTIKIFGCGTGREINPLAEFYNPLKIIASDISENMIAKCDYNLRQWHLNSVTETLVTDAKDYNLIDNYFDLVTMLNSMLTYVSEKQDRLTIFRNVFQILKPKATVIGTVHNQVGTPAKTLYFKIRSTFCFC